MKIADYAVTMQSSHAQSMQHSVQESLRVWAERPAAPPASLPQEVVISDAARQKQANEAAATNVTGDPVTNDPNLQMLVSLIERLTGRKVRVFDARQLQAASASAPVAPRSGAEYTRTESYSESEQTTFQASGVIKTSDGKEIKFDLNLAMQHQYNETRTTTAQAGDAPRKTDPLVVNFSGTAAQLSAQRFAFDLNSDGQDEQINAPAAGSGFLVLDKNGDGKINNGGELFGPASGNGFAELARYDSDHNGWIDENDAVYSQLKVWTKDASGQDQLASLASLGVGAISLASVATPFDIKTAGNQLLGSVRSSSVALKEDGHAVSVQQVDLTA